MRILIVEDEEKLAQGIATGLKKQGFAVDILGDGNDALNRISLYKKEYDLVILDLMLPGLDGSKVCKQVRQLGITLPILVLTAKTQTENKVDLLQTGADDYMVKPFSFQELLARINALSRRPHEAKPIVLTCGDIQLDTNTQTVHCGKTEIELTLKEFVLLKFFMSHPNTVLERENILEHLWDFNFLGFSNVVDVHVKNLRKKLGKEGHGRIQTVRGVGYQMVE